MKKDACTNAAEFKRYWRAKINVTLQRCNSSVVTKETNSIVAWPYLYTVIWNLSLPDQLHHPARGACQLFTAWRRICVAPWAKTDCLVWQCFTHIAADPYPTTLRYASSSAALYRRGFTQGEEYAEFEAEDPMHVLEDIPGVTACCWVAAMLLDIKFAWYTCVYIIHSIMTTMMRS